MFLPKLFSYNKSIDEDKNFRDILYNRAVCVFGVKIYSHGSINTNRKKRATPWFNGKCYRAKRMRINYFVKIEHMNIIVRLLTKRDILEM